MCVFCWNFVDGLYVEIYGFNVYFVGILLMDYVLKLMVTMCDFVGILLKDYVLKFMGSMCVFCWDFIDGFVMKIDG